MKWRSIIFYGLLVAMSFYSMQSCQCNREEDVKPDPCVDAQEVVADFVIYDPLRSYQENMFAKYWEIDDSDTLIQGDVVFSASLSGATYEWILGAETLDVQSFSRHSFPVNHPITVSLKVNKQASNLCFPNDDGVDFKERTFVLVPPDSTRVKGRFRGATTDAPTDSFEIYIDPWLYYPLEFGEVPMIENLTQSGCQVQFKDWEVQYRKIYFGHNTFMYCKRPMGVAEVYGEGYKQIKISYSEQVEAGDSHDQIENRVDKVFYGYKIAD